MSSHVYPSVALARVLVVQAEDLEAKDIRMLGPDTSDPYAVLTVNNMYGISEFIGCVNVNLT